MGTTAFPLKIINTKLEPTKFKPKKMNKFLLMSLEKLCNLGLKLLKT